MRSKTLCTGPLIRISLLAYTGQLRSSEKLISKYSYQKEAKSLVYRPWFIFHLATMIKCSVLFLLYTVPLLMAVDPTSMPSGQPTAKPSEQCSLCDPGEYFDDCSCSPCEPGHYCLGACNTPDSCGAGTYNPQFGSENIFDCLECPDGFYSNIPGSDNCTACPKGHRCLDKSVTPEVCPKGTYSNLFSMFCETCPLGSYNIAPGSDRCVVCPGGYACPSVDSGIP